MKKLLLLSLSILLPMQAFAQAQTLTATWGAVTTDANGVALPAAPSPGALSGYHLHYGITSGNYTTHLDAKNVTSFTFPAPAPGSYFFTVTAYDIAGLDGAFSNEVQKTVNPVIPAAPGAFSVR